MRRPQWTLILATLLLAAGGISAGTNLVVNGGFDHAGDLLFGWTYDYRYTGNSFYMKNHEHVSVVPRDGTRHDVLRLSGTRAIFWGGGQGVKVDSKPIPYRQGALYRLTVSARTTRGPNCRIYVEGYMWKPGIHPHANPDLDELRRVYRQGAGYILYFNEPHDGPFSNAGTTWQTASAVFPGEGLPPEALAPLRQVRFLVVHIIAIDGHDGELYVDDVSLEELPQTGTGENTP